MCAGKKETVGKREAKRQKHLLNDSLRNLHKKFCESHCSKMSYAKFCYLRPLWIIEPQVKDRETCLCVRHANMELLVQRLHRVSIIKERSPSQLCNVVMCDAKSKSCMYGECRNCQSRVVSADNLASSSDRTFYYKWTTKTEKRINETDGSEINVKITVKENVEATHQEMVSILNSELTQYKQHAYRVYHQQVQLDQMKSNLSQNECILIVDFSENYVLVCKYAAETQSVHFGASRQQVTLHMAVPYYRSPDDSSVSQVDCKSFCTISSSLRHDASATWAHLQPILSFISQKLDHVNTLHIWSDGPTTQYRNKNNFAMFSHFSSFSNFWSATGAVASRGVLGSGPPSHRQDDP